MTRDQLLEALELKIATLERENHDLKNKLQSVELREQVRKHMEQRRPWWKKLLRLS